METYLPEVTTGALSIVFVVIPNFWSVSRRKFFSKYASFTLASFCDLNTSPAMPLSAEKLNKQDTFIAKNRQTFH